MAVSGSLSQINVDLLRRLLYLYKTTEGNENNVLPCLREQLSLMTTPNEILDFLIDNKYIGYLNYDLLHEFLKLIRSKVLEEKMEHYETSFSTHLHFNFSTIAKIYKERPDLAPTSPTGLPKFIMVLQPQWEKENVFSWKRFFDHRFQWAPDLIVVHCSLNSVHITYAVLPSSVSLVVKDLSNTEILKQLKDSGVTVELSSELLDFEQRLKIRTHENIRLVEEKVILITMLLCMVKGHCFSKIFIAALKKFCPCLHSFCIPVNLILLIVSGEITNCLTNL